MAGLLGGKLALVTGGGSGIGRAVCIALGREGAKVVVTDINGAAAKATASTLSGDSHSWFTVDVGQSQSVNTMMEAVLAKYKQPPTIAVNCAGITRDNFIAKMDEHSFDEVIRVNLKGTFLITQAVSQAMISGGANEGSIVNLASIVGKVGNMGQCNYAASKAGVEGLTKSTAKELAKFGIRCNAILPGFIDTPMVATVPEKLVEKILHLIPLGRFGKPEEVAELCVFLASNKSSYITGTSIEITGGIYM